jgi:hypothetical protein
MKTTDKQMIVVDSAHFRESPPEMYEHCQLSDGSFTEAELELTFAYYSIP